MICQWLQKITYQSKNIMSKYKKLYLEIKNYHCASDNRSLKNDQERDR